MFSLEKFIKEQHGGFVLVGFVPTFLVIAVLCRQSLKPSEFTDGFDRLRHELAGPLLLFCFIPPAILAYVISQRSSVVGAIAQLGAMQDRRERRKEVVRAAVHVDKLWFCLGVANVAITAYISGGWPQLYHLYYTPKVVALIALRWFKFRQKRQHYLLWDFCYWVNFLCLFYCWLAPTSSVVFQIAFLCANGPLAWSVLGFNHAMIFHSYAHVTSVVVHLSPLILTYGLRWHCLEDSYFTVCDAGDCSVSPLTLIYNAVAKFYLWWIVLYYIWIFVFLGKRIEERGYQTLWDRILVMPPLGPALQNMLTGGVPKLIVQAVYLFVHLGVGLCTLVIATMLWYSQIAHFLFLGLISLSTVKNASEFYFDVFAQHYEMVLEKQKEEGRITNKELEKKLFAASPGLASMDRGC